MSRRILYVETYHSGSHARVLEILQACSRHQIDTVTLPAEHWRWRFIAAHHEIAAKLTSDPPAKPDAIVLSGPINVPAMLQLLPRFWSRIPVAVYLHESQWTYPTEPFDIRPYLLSHLDALEIANSVWFNSSYHRDTFKQAALQSSSPRIRKLARKIVARRWDRTRVIYPPVQLDTDPESGTIPRRAYPRVLWAARWEQEKRPDRFVAAVKQLRERGAGFDVVLLGTGAGLEQSPYFERIRDVVAIAGAVASRREYEALVSTCDAVVSTTDHEFFGVAMIEAAFAGVTPVLPNAHAYPETLPSAFFYPDGDIDALTRTLQAVLKHPWTSPRPWTSDARRFLAGRAVAAFDDACDDLVEGRICASR